MPCLRLKVLNKANHTLEVGAGNSGRAYLVHTAEYHEGDRIVLNAGKDPCYCVVQFEDSMPETLIYVTGDDIAFKIPFGDQCIGYSPKAFTGSRHLITARFATDEEIYRYRNLALNPYDQHGDNGFFPHASANVETRNEAVFAARNAIDGIFANVSHGEYPYQSWGINRDPNAAMKLDFGREVSVDKLILTLRADFPHDNYWTRASVEFSDGSNMTLNLKKTGERQIFSFDKKTISWLVLKDLIKSEELSPFPALTQIEVLGCDLPKEAKSQPEKSNKQSK